MRIVAAAGPSAWSKSIKHPCRICGRLVAVVRGMFTRHRPIVKGASGLPFCDGGTMPLNGPAVKASRAEVERRTRTVPTIAHYELPAKPPPVVRKRAAPIVVVADDQAPPPKLTAKARRDRLATMRAIASRRS